MEQKRNEKGVAKRSETGPRRQRERRKLYRRDIVVCNVGIPLGIFSRNPLPEYVGCCKKVRREREKRRGTLSKRERERTWAILIRHHILARCDFMTVVERTKRYCSLARCISATIARTIKSNPVIQLDALFLAPLLL